VLRRRVWAVWNFALDSSPSVPEPCVAEPCVPELWLTLHSASWPYEQSASDPSPPDLERLMTTLRVRVERRRADGEYPPVSKPSSTATSRASPGEPHPHPRRRFCSPTSSARWTSSSTSNTAAEHQHREAGSRRARCCTARSRRSSVARSKASLEQARTSRTESRARSR